ncbi:hypothetical protein AKJ39_01390 [candidate division MSBL1 archaeon SCGC-AAA259J03]|uniref:Uncharacterized protein n=1 Tax=candidate division MSBL1 archaeon SCGC-AAA259J03 TaxID=1698269 RepID=A0A656Z068_9EURY|nr:hypothetical protein AKJ39_01390 [candidate division MSBL1 archaeon SCGC-AAA259J03]
MEDRMDVCIVGAGPAGVYSSYLLSNAHNVWVFDKKRKNRLWNDCAWGTGRRELDYFCDVLKLKPEDYVLHEAEEIISNVFYNKVERPRPH